MNKKQTAVEWLIDQIRNHKLTFYNHNDKKEPISLGELDIVEQAKAMERQQIVDAWNERDRDVIKSDGNTGNKYFTETYGENIKTSTNE